MQQCCKTSFMKKRGLLLVFLLSTFCVIAQTPSGKSFIRDMQWEADDRIHLTLFNDSGYYMKVKDIIHANTIENDTLVKDFVYYPVMLARDFVDKLNQAKIKETTVNTDEVPATIPSKPLTLWSALHESIGGGWVHFINCLLYSLETNYVSLTAPLMERPKTKWKPDPETETYKRTQNWKYYVPVDQKQAQKEYRLKEKAGQLAGLHDVPTEFIKLFFETSNREYQKIIKSNDIRKQARIDLVKLLLGANYLGEAQISYIKSMVKKAVLKYSYNQLPTVIVYDNMDAAVVLSLNESGYNLEKLVFLDAQSLSDDEKQTRQQKIESTIFIINRRNQQIFEERLRKFYK
jgi:hypothetical protein